MRTVRVPRCTLGICAAGSMLASCGVPPSTFNPFHAAAQSGTAVPGGTKSGDLMYVGGTHGVEIYTYPAGSYQETIETPGLVSGMCSDSKGNVFAALTAGGSSSDNGAIYEYMHGGTKPIAKLDVPKHEIPIDCSSDPETGNLAVTLRNSRDYAPSVAIYPRASGAPKIYVSRAIGAAPQAGYDDRGDLFATSGGNVGAELPMGKTGFTTIKLSETLGGVAHVQWDGTYLALQSFVYLKHNREKLHERIFRVQISGSTGKVASRSRFHGWPEKDPGESWIQGGTIVATPSREIVFWAYPAGGNPRKVIRHGRPGNAITVSVAR